MKTTPVKGQKKYDWIRLKEKFLLSDHTQVKPFLMEEVGQYSGTLSTNCRGWAKEKQKRIEKIVEEGLKRWEENEAEKIAEGAELYAQECRRRGEDANIKNLSYKELKSNWEVLRTMDGRVTRITKEKVQKVENENEDSTFNRLIQRAKNSAKDTPGK